jgi:hypothetical protein
MEFDFLGVLGVQIVGKCCWVTVSTAHPKYFGCAMGVQLGVQLRGICGVEHVFRYEKKNFVITR